MVQVSVADSGPGLSNEVQRRLFQPFVTTKPNGMGVGLSVCRTIIEAHGGRLWAESSSQEGAVFRFTLKASGQPLDPSA
jgi:two-component system sensor kinase FixL